MTEPYDCAVHPVELLSCSSGELGDQAVLILTMRLDPEVHFVTSDLAIPAAQAVRLYKELGDLLASSQYLGQAARQIEGEVV